MHSKHAVNSLGVDNTLICSVKEREKVSHDGGADWRGRETLLACPDIALISVFYSILLVC